MSAREIIIIALGGISFVTLCFFLFKGQKMSAGEIILIALGSTALTALYFSLFIFFIFPLLLGQGGRP